MVPNRLFRVGFLWALWFPPSAIRQMAKALRDCSSVKILQSYSLWDVLQHLISTSCPTSVTHVINILVLAAKIVRIDMYIFM